MGGIPLPHGGPDAPEHGPCGLIGDSDLAGQQHGRDPALVPGDEIEGQKTLAQADMAAVQDRSGCDGGLPVAVGTLIQPVGQAATVFVPAFRANEPIRPSLCGQIVPTAFLSSEPVQKLTQGHPLLP